MIHAHPLGLCPQSPNHSYSAKSVMEREAAFSFAGFEHRSDARPNRWQVLDQDKGRQKCMPGCIVAGSLLVLVLSLATFSLMFVSLMSFSDVVLSNQRNIILHDESTPNVQEPRIHLLVPQVDVSLGPMCVCIASRCSNRDTVNGTWNLLPSPSSVGKVLGVQHKVYKAYVDVYHQFAFGYNAGEHCGASTSRIYNLSAAATAAHIVGLFSVICEIVLCIFFFVEITLVVSAAQEVKHRQGAYIGEQQRTMTVEFLPSELKSANAKVRNKGMRFLWAMTSVAIVSFLCSLLSTTVVGMLLLRLTKCGQGVCAVYLLSMERLVEAMGEETKSSGVPYATCTWGFAFILRVVACGLALAVAVLATSLCVAYSLLPMHSFTYATALYTGQCEAHETDLPLQSVTNGVRPVLLSSHLYDGCRNTLERTALPVHKRRNEKDEHLSAPNLKA